MPLAVVGVSHRTAPVEVRERMAFGPSETSRALLALRQEAGVEEAVLLSTCNRTEVYLYPSRDASHMGLVGRLLEGKAGPLERPAQEYLFQHRGDGAVRHLFQVSSGLDSMVTGEAEIQGQVRDAYELATSLTVDPPMAGPVLNRLFQMALSVGGRVRAETAINEGSASVASVSVELARKIFGSLRDKRVMILGAGATAELVVEALSREGVRGILVANRTYDRAVELAQKMHGHAVHFDRLAESLASADIVLASTAAPHHVLSRETFRRAFPGKRGHPLLIIDIAIPRDVDPAVGDEPEVFLYNVDDLRKIVDEHVKVRAEAIPEADRIIQSHSRAFRTWYASLEVVPVIRSMRERAEAHRALELGRLMRGMDHLGEEDRARLEEFSRRLLNKLLHEPTVRLRKGMTRGGQGEELVDAVRFLYGLEEQDHPSKGGEGKADANESHDEPEEGDP
jgi:glutamyl-tRNA reductase